MNRWLKYAIATISSLIILLILLFAGVGLYIKSNKKEMIAKLIKEADTKYHTQISVGDLSLSLFKSFPSLTLVIEKIDARGPMHKVHNHKLFTASEIYLRLNTFKLLFGNFSFGKAAIKNGNAFIYTDSSGVNDLSYFKEPIEKNKKREGALVLPENITIENFDFTIDDKQKNKLFSFLIRKLAATTLSDGDNTYIDIKKDILVKSLGFNLSTGSFLVNHILEGKYRLSYNRKRNDLSFNDIKINISKQPFVLTGTFLFGERGHFNLDVKTKQISYGFAQTLVTNHIATGLKNVTLTAPLDVHTTLEGSLNGGDPLVIARWSVRETDLTSPLVSLKKASFVGYFTNEAIKGKPLKDPNSTIHINNLVALWEGIPLKADTVEIINLEVPVVNGNFVSDFQLSAFNEILNSNNLVFSEGAGKLAVKYRGPLKNINNQNALLDIAFLLTKGSITYKPMKLVITECVSNISIKNSDVFINRLAAKSSNGSKIKITGEARNTFALLGDSPGKVGVTVNIYSPYLNLEGITSKIQRDRSKIKKLKKNVLNSSISRLDNILEKQKITVNIKADKIKNNHLIANNFIANVALSENVYQINALQFGMANGTLQLSSSIIETGINKHKLNSVVQIKNIDAKELFYAFDDFGINAISYKNLAGQISANGNFSTSVNAAGVVDKKTLQGKLSFSLKNGSIINYAPLMKIQEIVLKKRDFTDVRFAEIKNTVTIKEGIVNVPRMQIESSVIKLFVEGQYGLVGETDLRIQVPLANLRNNDRSNMNKKANNAQKGGASVYLRAKSGNDGKVSIGLDLLGAMRKSNVPSTQKN